MWAVKTCETRPLTACVRESPLRNGPLPSNDPADARERQAIHSEDAHKRFCTDMLQTRLGDCLLTTQTQPSRPYQRGRPCRPSATATR